MMVVAKLFQIRVKDKVVVWQFYNDKEEIGKDKEPFGSRGITVTKDELKEVMMAMIDADGMLVVEVKDNPETVVEQVVKRAYDEYLNARKVEEEENSQVIEA